MKLAIYLSPKGLAEAAEGGVPSYWAFSVRLPEHEHAYNHTPEAGYRLLGEVELELPSQEAARKEAVQGLQQELSAMRATHQQQQMDLQNQINDLLMLGYAEATEVDDDDSF